MRLSSRCTIALAATVAMFASVLVSSPPAAALGTTPTGTTVSVIPPPAPDIFLTQPTLVGEVLADGAVGPTFGSGLHSPKGVAVDHAGDVFIADSADNQVLEVPAGGGPQTTIGSGLHDPSGVAVDSAGDVFIADTGDLQLVEVPAGAGPQTTVHRFSSPGPTGVAVDSAGDVFVVTDGFELFEEPAGGGPQLTVASALFEATAVAVDAAGDLFVAEPSQVVEVPANGGPATLVNSGGWINPTGVAVDSSGDLFVADSGANTVVKISAGLGTPTTVLSGAAGLNGLAVDFPATDAAFGASVTLRATVLTVPPDTAVTSPPGGTPTGSVTFLAGSTTLGTANLSGTYPDTATLTTTALALGSNEVTAAYAGSDGPPGDGSSTSPPITVDTANVPGAPTQSAPTSAVNGNVTLNWSAPSSDGGFPLSGYEVFAGTSSGGEDYSTPACSGGSTATSCVASGLTNGTTYYFTVEALNAAGASIASNETSATPILTATPTGVTVSVMPPPAPDLFIGDANFDHGVEIPAGGGAQIDVGPFMSGAGAVAVDAAGNLFYVDSTSSEVWKTPVTVGQISVLVGSGLLHPHGVAVDSAGDVFIADTGNGRVVKVPAGGGPQTTVGSGLSGPYGVAVDSAGDVFISDPGQHQVVEVSAQGLQTAISGGLSDPEGVAVDAAGDVFIADHLNARVVEVPADGAPQTNVLSNLFGASGVAVDAAGDLFVGLDTFSGNPRVVELPAGGSSLVQVGSGFDDPNNVAVDVPTADAAPGASVVLRATVMTSPPGGTPPGTVTFMAGSTNLGSANLSGTFPDTATLTTTSLAVGASQITATYGGSSVAQGDGTATSAPITVLTANVPGAPTQSAPSAVANGNVTLNWSAPTSDGGVPVTGYDVFAGISPGGEDYSTPSCSAGPTATSCVVSGLTNGTTYYFTVEARNAIGASTASNETSATPVVKSSQTITFTSVAPTGAIVGGPSYTVSATGGGSNNPVTFTLDGTSAGCALSGSTVTFLAARTCVIDANQAENAGYTAAPQAQQSFAVGKGAQAITFTSVAPTGAFFSGPSYTVTATGGPSNKPVTFTLDGTSTACALNGSILTFSSIGVCVINADQAGNANYNAAPQAQQSFAVNRIPQAITFTSVAPTGASVGGPSYNVSATGGGSGVPLIFTLDGTSSGCALTGSAVTFIFFTTGTCVIDVNQAGTGSYSPAPRAQQSFAVGKGAQSITFASVVPTEATVGGPAYGVSAIGGVSGNPVTFTVDSTSSLICSVTGSTVSFSGIGTCVINADQAGSASYSAAPQAQQSFAVGMGAQSITFASNAPTGASVGGANYTVSASGGGSNNAITFALDGTSSGCALSGSTVSFSAIGTCVIDANQAGSASYNAAPQAQQSFAVGKGAQAITVASNAPTGASAGGPGYIVSATGGASGNPVTFTIDSTSSSICSVTGSTVSFSAIGTCVIDANQAGSANYNAAPQAQQSFAVGKGTQAIAFASVVPIGASAGGPSYIVSATGGASNNAITFTLDGTSSGCALSGSTVSFSGIGTCVIDANQAGSASYNAAPQAQQSFAVGKGAQAITFASVVPTGASAGDPSYIVSATGGASGNPVTFTIDSTSSSICTISGSTVTISVIGTCVIDADQAGSANYNAAPQQSLAVGNPLTSGTGSSGSSGGSSNTSGPITHGYWLVGSDGGIFTYGHAHYYGSTGNIRLQRPVVAIVPTADRGGYWLVATDGGIFAFGDAVYYGSIPGLGLHPARSGLPNSLNAPIVAMVPSADGGGYFLVAADGGVFAFGDAIYEGSCPGIGGCRGTAVAVVPDGSGAGYWLTTATGNVYTFGDAPYLGAPGAQPSAITAMARSHDGAGYWIMDANGQVFAYGNAPYLGAPPLGTVGGVVPASAIFATSDGAGYWITATDGTVYTFGDAPFDGDATANPLNGPIVAATGY